MAGSNVDNNGIIGEVVSAPHVNSVEIGSSSPHITTKGRIEDTHIGITTPTSTASSDNLPLSLFTSNIVIVVNKQTSRSSSLGPFLDPQKVQALPPRFGPGPINRVLRQAVQKLVDASLDQKQVLYQLYALY